MRGADPRASQRPRKHGLRAAERATIEVCEPINQSICSPESTGSWVVVLSVFTLYGYLERWAREVFHLSDDIFTMRIPDHTKTPANSI